MKPMRKLNKSDESGGRRKRVVILSGGFAGVYTAQYLEKAPS